MIAENIIKSFSFLIAIPKKHAKEDYANAKGNDIIQTNP